MVNVSEAESDKLENSWLRCDFVPCADLVNFKCWMKSANLRREENTSLAI